MHAEFSQGKLFEKYGGKPVRIARDEVAAPDDRYSTIPLSCTNSTTRPVSVVAEAVYM